MSSIKQKKLNDSENIQALLIKGVYQKIPGILQNLFIKSVDENCCWIIIHKTKPPKYIYRY